MRKSRTNNQIKRRESEQFNAYLDTLERIERAEFINELAVKANVNKNVVYGWCYMCSRIPDNSKKIIESMAGCRIFTQPIIFSKADFGNFESDLI